MEHKFNVKAAEKIGLHEAIILENLRFWCDHNMANGKNMHDGMAWTFNSVKAFSELFPYMSSGQITRALKNLEAGGYIKTGNFNAQPYDRTKWYAVTKLGYALVENEKCICQNRKMETSETTNGIAASDEPIPVIKPVTKPLENKDRDNTAFSEWRDAYNEFCPSLQSCLVMSDKRKSAVRSMKKQGVSLEDFKEACRIAESSDFLKGKNDRGWSASPDWMFNANNVLKVLEGNYSPRKGNNQEAGVISIIDDETRRFLEAM